MQTIDIYLKLDKCIKIKEKDVFLKDVAKVYCSDDVMLAKARSIKVFTFKDEGPHRKCISSLCIIQMLSELSPAVSVQSVGEMDVLVEYGGGKKISPFLRKIKIAVVVLVSFFGTAFTIMAFHNDIGIEDLFSGIHEQVMGEPSGGLGVLEFSYSIGLAVGITLFFNHMGNKRLTVDPTPIEVEMKMYEDDINTAIMEDAKREGESMEEV